MLRRFTFPVRGLAVLPLVAAASVGLLAAPARADTPPYGTSSNDTPAPCAAGTVNCPTQDAFFSPPSNLGTLADGAVVGSRSATLATPTPAVKAAYTITYRSEDSFGAPVLDSGTILLPTTPWAGTGAQPLVSWQFPEDSVGAQCRPSYALAHTGTNGNVDAEQGLVHSLLAQGIIVVAPDFQGPAEMYEVGPQSGHAVLDGIRAAENFTPTGLSRLTPVALNGYSGGAYATGWGAELAKSYASDLTIVGAAMGGTPADQAVTGHYLDGTVFSGLALLTTIALDRAYPALGVYDDLNDTGKQLFADNQGSCVGAATKYAFARFDTYTTAPNFIGSPAIAATLAHDDLGQAPPTFPVLNYHVYNDEIVPYNQDQVLVKKYCQGGTPVDHIRIPAADHVSGEAIAAPSVLAFLQARFQGTAFVSACQEIAAEPPLSQIPSITTPATPNRVLPEAPAPVLLGVAGLAAGALVLRRRRTRP